MATFTIDNFAGGLTLDGDNAPPNKMVECVGFTYSNGRLRTRPGVEFFSYHGSDANYRLPYAAGGNPIHSINVFEPKPSTISLYRFRVIAAASNTHTVYISRLYGSTPSYTVPNRVGSFVGHSFSADYDTSNFFSAQNSFTGNTGSRAYVDRLVETERGIYFTGYTSSLNYRVFRISLIEDPLTQTYSYYNADLPNIETRGPSTIALSGSGAGSTLSAGTHTYYFHYYYQYVHNGKTFIDYGPVTVKEVTILANQNVSMTGLNVLDGADESYSASNSTNVVGIAIYAVRPGSTTPYFVGLRSRAATTYTDTGAVGSKGTTLLGDIVYTDGGVLDDESVFDGRYSYTVVAEPLYLTLANNCLWAVNSTNSTEVYYTKPLKYHTFRGDFVINFKEIVRTMGSVDVYPIVFFRNSIKRLEGNTDERGVGIVSVREVSNSIGTNRSEIQRIDKHIYFIGPDGLYRTDGFNVEEVNTDWISADDIKFINRGKFGYDNINKKLYYSVVIRVSSTDSVTRVYEFDLTLPGVPCIIHYQSPQYASSYSGDVSFMNPIHIFCAGGFLNFAQNKSNSTGPSYLYKFSPYLSDDVKIDLANADLGTWKKQAIISSLTTSSLSLGTRFVTKWFTKLYLFVKNQGSLWPDVSLKVTRVPDSDNAPTKEFKEIRERGNTRWMHRIKRWFPAGVIRSEYTQLKIETPLIIRYNSDSYATATTNPLVPNAVLAGATAWPSSIVGETLYFENDGYTTGYVISSHTDGSDTVVLASAPPSYSNAKWYIKGYPRNEIIEIDGIEIEYSQTGETIEGFKTSDTGENV